MWLSLHFAFPLGGKQSARLAAVPADFVPAAPSLHAVLGPRRGALGPSEGKQRGQESLVLSAHIQHAIFLVADLKEVWIGVVIIRNELFIGEKS